MASLKAYLAEKYMSGPKADAILAKTSKKKKRKAHNSGSSTVNSMIRDEDAGWGDLPKDEDDDDVSTAVVASDRSFKKRKVAGPTESNWVTIDEGVRASALVKEGTPPPADDERPLVVGEPDPEPVMAGLIKSGAKKKKRANEDPEAMLKSMTAEEIALAQETVYRDASGQKIDMKAAKAEAERQKRLREESEAAKKEWTKGLVQREDAEKRRQELEKQKGKEFRRIDDADMNEELKSKELWNDPAVQFLSVREPPLPTSSETDSLHRKRTREDPVVHNMLGLPLPQIVSELNLDIDGMALVRIPLLLERPNPYQHPSRPLKRIREEVLPKQELSETSGRGKLCVGR